MGIDRSGTYNEATDPTGLEFLEQYGDFVDALIDTAVLRLASVAGTNTITATAEPFTVPSSGYVTGMKFTLEPVNDNTGAVTLNIDGRGAKSVVNADGSALAADALLDGTKYLLEYDGTDLRIIGSASAAGAAGASRTTYDTTTVWDNIYSTNTLIMVELWGAGGGGSTGAGGGGASYARAIYKAGDLPSTVTITIPAGGAGGSTGVTGGNATFGSLLEAFGGSRGTASGGGGGGELDNSNSTTGGSVGGGLGGTTGANAGTIHGGGGGGTTGAGGDAVNGGGGGSGTGTGGSSKYGGNGGTGIEAGQRPGGGGGRTSNGGAGRAIVTVF